MSTSVGNCLGEGDTLRISATSLHCQKLQSMYYSLVKTACHRSVFVELYHNVMDRQTDFLMTPITMLSRADVG